MKKSTTGVLAGLAASALAAAGLVSAGIGPASAALTAAEIRLVTPVLVAGSTAWDGQSLADGWVGNNWYAAGITFKRAYAPVGSNIILTYYATDADTKAPLANTQVKLRVNKAYSGSNALVKVGTSATTNGIEKSNGTDQLQVTAKTDQFGYVTFVLDNTDTVGEPQPATLASAAPGLAQDADPKVSLYSQIYPEITGQATDKADMTEFHFYTPSGDALVSPNLTSTVTRVAAPALTATSAIERADLDKLFSVDNNWYAPGIHVWQKYHPINSSSNLVYTVADNAGVWVPNAEVKLSVGKAYSKSTAKVTNGTSATDLSVAEDKDQAVWTATTDPFGTFMFELKNTDTAGEAKPASLTSPVPTSGAKYSQMWPVVTGATTNVADMLEYHFYSDAPPVAETTAIALARSGRVISVTVNKPMGKSVSITVGSTTFSSTPAASAESAKFTVRVAAGSVKITVACNGKKKSASYKVS